MKVNPIAQNKAIVSNPDGTKKFYAQKLRNFHIHLSIHYMWCSIAVNSGPVPSSIVFSKYGLMLVPYPGH